jgi:hypothetical protein
MGEIGGIARESKELDTLNHTMQVVECHHIHSRSTIFYQIKFL